MNALGVGDPVIWRGIERIIVSLGAIAFAYLGYKLYQTGIVRGKNRLDVKSSFLKFALSGTGPGLIFMAFGATVLVAGLFYGKASVEDPTRGKKWLYAEGHKDCEKLLGSPDESLVSALKTSRIPWAPRLADRFTDPKALRQVVEVLCEE